jgi:hypothetical protein
VLLILHAAEGPLRKAVEAITRAKLAQAAQGQALGQGQDHGSERGLGLKLLTTSVRVRALRRRRAQKASRLIQF